MGAIISLSAGGATERAALKQDYLNCLGRLAANTGTLRGIVERLLSLGVSRNELVEWAGCEGYNERAIRKLLSSLRLQAGERLRKPGAGPKTPPEALVIQAFARDLFGDQGDKFLHAASRDAKKQAAAKRTRNQEPALSRSGISVDAPPQTIAAPPVILPVALARAAGLSSRSPRPVNHGSYEIENNSTTHHPRPGDCRVRHN
jgi:hypothetical protein